ncbi:MAG: hypothetical protein JSW50_12775 [Candidatus Latescibacterota bacterium]|nr:MAG: hypothetical protein JSW50_12775 [Candidatus Latescibacterota bacterium]
MKTLLLSSLIVMLCANLAFGQAGSIGLFADPGATVCDVIDMPGILIPIYVVHLWSPGATAAQYKVAPFNGAAMLWLSDTTIYPVNIGNSQTGIATGFGVCVPSPNHILTINYFGQGLSASCSHYQVVPDPLAVPSGILVVDCADNILIATGGDVVVNPTSTCYCDVPVEKSTWGKIKELYTN